MKVQIQDAEALSSLSLVSLRSYLKSHGWRDGGDWGGGRATLYLKEHDGETYDILVPMRDTVADYARGMADAVSAISTVEERSQLEVFHDLKSVGTDVIRVCSLNGLSKGILSLQKSANLLGNSYSMLSAAARAAEHPRAAYRGKVSSDVSGYLDQVQPLQDYFEGYKLTLHSPVPIRFASTDDMFGEEFDLPFARSVVYRLCEALTETGNAISNAFVNDMLDGFDDAVSYGVNANLCDAVASLADGGQGVSIDVSWAQLRPDSKGVKSSFKFSKDSVDVLKDAAVSLRRKEPLFDESIVAHVVKLEREPSEFDGHATILYVQDDQPLRIDVQFERKDYDLVIDAFKGHKTVRLQGDIHRAGQGYQLRNQRNLALAG